MQNIPIQAIPNQSFSIVLDGNNWGVLIKSTNGAISVSLTLNGTDVIDNQRAVANMRIIPAQYEEAGNFAIVTLNQQVPDYTQFGITQNLIYASAAEIAATRVPTPAQIVAADFDPIAPLPLRFKPQGYILA